VPSKKNSANPAVIPWRIRALNRVLPQGFGRWRLDSSQALEATAQRACNDGHGLSQNSRMALEELLRSYRASAQLHPVGELMTAINLLAHLKNQLNVNAAHKSNPTITRRTITAPVFITGLPRTGSTLLHNLLALDPQFRTPQSWAVSYPTPRPDSAASQRRKVRNTQRLFGLIELLHPGFRAIHELDANLPQECLVIMASAMRSHLFFSSTFVPDYQDWLDEQPQALMYEHHLKILQLLQDDASERSARWVLKAPSHLFSINGLLHTYPDCRIVYTHRAPEQVVGSIASLHWHLYRTFSNFTDTAELGRQVNRRWGQAQSAFEARLQSDKNLHNRTSIIDYASFVQDPVATIRELYGTLGLQLTAQTAAAMNTYLRTRPQHRFGTHDYALADYSLTRHDVEQAFEHRSSSH